MKTNQITKQAIAQTRAEMLRALSLAPETPYAQCTASDRANYDKLAECVRAHRLAVRAHRLAHNLNA